MKRLLLVPVFLAVAAAVAVAVPKPGEPKKEPAEAPKLQLFVSTVMWSAKGQITVGSYVQVGTDADMMPPLVANDLASKFPEGYVLISIKTTPVKEDLILALVADRMPVGKARATY